MEALRAHVKNGQIVLDEPAELAEGMELEVRPAGTRFDDLSAGERAAIEAGLDEAEAAIRAGKSVDALEFVRELRTREAQTG